MKKKPVRIPLEILSDEIFSDAFMEWVQQTGVKFTIANGSIIITDETLAMLFKMRWGR